MIDPDVKFSLVCMHACMPLTALEVNGKTTFKVDFVDNGLASISQASFEGNIQTPEKPRMLTFTVPWNKVLLSQLNAMLVTLCSIVGFLAYFKRRRDTKQK